MLICLFSRCYAFFYSNIRGSQSQLRPGISGRAHLCMSAISRYPDCWSQLLRADHDSPTTSTANQARCFSCYPAALWILSYACPVEPVVRMPCGACRTHGEGRRGFPPPPGCCTLHVAGIPTSPQCPPWRQHGHACRSCTNTYIM